MRKFFESGLAFMLVALVWIAVGLLSGRPGLGALGVLGRVPRRVEKGSGVIFRLLSTSRPEGRRTGGLRRARTYQGRRVA